MNFKKINIKDFSLNPVTTFSDEWMLLTAGNENDGYNTMTVSWGHLGSIWGKGFPTAVVYVRPQRYTKEFMDKENYFTLCVFDEAFKEKLAYLGSHSGRDGDKVEEVGLTQQFYKDTVFFKEAKLIIVCRKLYQSRLQETGFVDKTIIENNYPDKDFHEMYIGEIVEILER